MSTGWRKRKNYIRIALCKGDAIHTGWCRKTSIHQFMERAGGKEMKLVRWRNGETGWRRNSTRDRVILERGAITGCDSGGGKIQRDTEKEAQGGTRK